MKLFYKKTDNEILLISPTIYRVQSAFICYDENIYR